ncbi:MAG: hypothetical protein ABEK16_04065 [Candidatus Nanohalobium sp.]
MPNYDYSPDTDVLSTVLDGLGDEFRTAEVRVKLSVEEDESPTEPLNRLLIDLAREGMLAPDEFDPAHRNHYWKKTELYEPDRIEDIVESYSSSNILRTQFDKVKSQALEELEDPDNP